ncbi:O-antigen ligase family protein [Pseudomonas purpurea]|uniref:O-antigen ligase family protein n=1 Tax=Pseudomonas purpurea TaxID=3136737 RepID=UPI0032648708
MTYQNNVILRFTLMVLIAGFITHVAGMIFITDGSTRTAVSNMVLFIPSLILCIGDARLRKSMIEKRYWLIGAMLIFTVAIAFTNSGSENSTYDQFKIALYIVLYLATIALLVREGKMEACLNILFVIAGVCAITSVVLQSILQDRNIVFSGYRLFSLGYGRYGDFQNPIIAALFYGFFGVYGFCQLLTKRYSLPITILFSACLVSLSLYVFCTGARGVWLGYGVAALTAAALFHTPRTRKWLMGAVLVAAVIGIWLSPVVREQQVRGFSLRDVIWEGWFARLNEFWLAGAGAGRSFDICIASGECFNQAHNLFLQFFYEYGVIGVLLMLTLLMTAFRQAADRRIWSAPLGSIGLPLLVFGMMTALFNYHTVMNRPGVYWIVFWLPLGVILAQHTRLNSACEKTIRDN